MKDALLNSIVHLSTLNLDKILSLMVLTEVPVPISFYYDIRVVLHLQATGRLGSPNLGLVHSTHRDGPHQQVMLRSLADRRLASDHKWLADFYMPGIYYAGFVNPCRNRKGGQAVLIKSPYLQQMHSFFFVGKILQDVQVGISPVVTARSSLRLQVLYFDDNVANFIGGSMHSGPSRCLAVVERLDI
jgi:hypothetical protein